MVAYAIKHGNKKATRAYKTTVKTVRKWRKRWDEEKSKGLCDKSKRPKHSPNIMKKRYQFQIQDIACQATEDNKRIKLLIFLNLSKVFLCKNQE